MTSRTTTYPQSQRKACQSIGINPPGNLMFQQAESDAKHNRRARYHQIVEEARRQGIDPFYAQCKALLTVILRICWKLALWCLYHCLRTCWKFLTWLHPILSDLLKPRRSTAKDRRFSGPHHVPSWAIPPHQCQRSRKRNPASGVRRFRRQ